MNDQTKVARYGNSLFVRIPVALARELDLREGDGVAIKSDSDGFFVARPIRSRLEARLATVRAAETEFASGHALGEEVFE